MEALETTEGFFLNKMFTSISLYMQSPESIAPVVHLPKKNSL